MRTHMEVVENQLYSRLGPIKNGINLAFNPHRLMSPDNEGHYLVSRLEVFERVLKKRVIEIFQAISPKAAQKIEARELEKKHFLERQELHVGTMFILVAVSGYAFASFRAAKLAKKVLAERERLNIAKHAIQTVDLPSSVPQVIVEHQKSTGSELINAMRNLQEQERKKSIALKKAYFRVLVSRSVIIIAILIVGTTFYYIFVKVVKPRLKKKTTKKISR